MPPSPTSHPVPSERIVQRLRSERNRLAGSVLKRIDSQYEWYRKLGAENRSWVGLVAQSTISAFVAWCENPETGPTATSEIFAVAPANLARTISLQYALQLVRTGVTVIEEEADSLFSPTQAGELREALLRYSRDFAFTAAEIYARAAELRGSWDARLEALAIDGLLRGDEVDSLRSRLSALGWHFGRPTLTMVVASPTPISESATVELRHAVRKVATDTLLGVLSDRIIIVLSGDGNLQASATSLLDLCGPGKAVIGPVTTEFEQIPRSLQAAARGMEAVAAWPSAPRPVLADDLLPERVLAGDATARETLVESIYTPLSHAGGDALLTLSAYVELGRSLEATSRALFVHNNTVRYRLRKIAELCGWDPTDPREAHVLHTAIAVGRLDTSH